MKRLLHCWLVGSFNTGAAVGSPLANQRAALWITRPKCPQSSTKCFIELNSMSSKAQLCCLCFCSSKVCFKIWQFRFEIIIINNIVTSCGCYETLQGADINGGRNVNSMYGSCFVNVKSYQTVEFLLLFFIKCIICLLSEASNTWGHQLATAFQCNFIQFSSSMQTMDLDCMSHNTVSIVSFSHSYMQILQS